MKEDIEFDTETNSKREYKVKKDKRNLYGVYIGICLIILGIVWYAINMGLIPIQYLQSWPQILLILVGILVVIKSL
jgi:uncharacterized integral membrane protein